MLLAVQQRPACRLHECVSPALEQKVGAALSATWTNAVPNRGIGVAVSVLWLACALTVCISASLKQEVGEALNAMSSQCALPV